MKYPCEPECGAVIKDGFAKAGIEVTVSTLYPILDTDYEDLSLCCPHGVRYHAEPTSDQQLRWREAGVA